MDLFYVHKKPLTSAAQTGHVIAASFGIILLSLFAFSILMRIFVLEQYFGLENSVSYFYYFTSFPFELFSFMT